MAAVRRGWRGGARKCSELSIYDDTGHLYPTLGDYESIDAAISEADQHYAHRAR